MAPKRKGSDTADAAPKGKKGKPSENDNEIERIYALGESYSDAHDNKTEIQSATSNEAKLDRDNKWEETLAQHLVRTPAFLQKLGETSDHRMFKIGLKFITSVHLYGRWMSYKGWTSFYVGWWRKKRQERHDRVLKRAIDIASKKNE